jgi:hypothetical protein
MKNETTTLNRFLRFLGQVTLLVALVLGLTLALCTLIGWRDAPGYALGLLIGGGTTTVVGAALSSEPMWGRGSSGRRGMEAVDKARAEERRQDRAHDRALLDRLTVTGVVVMALGLAVYWLLS